METAVKSYSLLTCDHDFAKALAVSHGMKIANLLGFTPVTIPITICRLKATAFRSGRPSTLPAPAKAASTRIEILCAGAASDVTGTGVVGMEDRTFR